MKHQQSKADLCVTNINLDVIVVNSIITLNAIFRSRLATGNPGHQGCLVLGLVQARLGKWADDRKSWPSVLSASGAWLGKSRQVG